MCPFLFHKIYYYCVSLTKLYLQHNLCKKIKISQQTKPNQKCLFFHITPILLIQEFATTCYIKMLHFLLLVIPNLLVFYTIQNERKKNSYFRKPNCKINFDRFPIFLSSLCLELYCHYYFLEKSTVLVTDVIFVWSNNIAPVFPELQESNLITSLLPKSLNYGDCQFVSHCFVWGQNPFKWSQLKKWTVYIITQNYGIGQLVF